jgi:hypothetical protein
LVFYELFKKKINNLLKKTKKTRIVLSFGFTSSFFLLLLSLFFSKISLPFIANVDAEGTQMFKTRARRCPEEKFWPVPAIIIKLLHF